MLLFKNDGRRREKKKFYRAGVGHGRANLLVLAWQLMARPCHCRHGPCQASGFLARW